MKNYLWYGLHIKHIISNLISLVVAFLFGSILFEIIIRVDSDADSTFPFGTFMTFLILVGIGLFANWQEEVQQFSLSVSMGRTRKRFLIDYSIQYYILMFIDFAFVYLLYNIEKLRLDLMYPQYEMEDFFGQVFNPCTFFLIPFVMLAVGLLIGGMGLKFGGNSKWIVMIVWIALCIGLSKIENGVLLVKFLNLPAFAYALIALGISVLFIVIAAVMMKDQRVDI